MADVSLQAHVAQLADNITTEWILQFSLPTDNEVFPDHGEEIIYTTSADAPIVHMVRFHVSTAARRGYHRVLSLGAADVKLARRIHAYSQWEDVTPPDQAASVPSSPASSSA